MLGELMNRASFKCAFPLSQPSSDRTYSHSTDAYQHVGYIYATWSSEKTGCAHTVLCSDMCQWKRLQQCHTAGAFHSGEDRLWQGSRKWGNVSQLLESSPAVGKDSSNKDLLKPFPVPSPCQSLSLLLELFSVVEKVSSSGEAVGRYAAKNNKAAGETLLGWVERELGRYINTYPLPSGVSLLYLPTPCLIGYPAIYPPAGVSAGRRAMWVCTLHTTERSMRCSHIHRVLGQP